jgi:hypothetical protein
MVKAMAQIIIDGSGDKIMKLRYQLMGGQGVGGTIVRPDKIMVKIGLRKVGDELKGSLPQMLIYGIHAFISRLKNTPTGRNRPVQLP